MDRVGTVIKSSSEKSGPNFWYTDWEMKRERFPKIRRGFELFDRTSIPRITKQ